MNKQLGIPRIDAYNREFILTQDQQFKNCNGDVCVRATVWISKLWINLFNGQEPTGGFNSGIYNLDGKAIVSYDNYSPTVKLRQKFNVDVLDNEQSAQLPEVKQWSDLVWVRIVGFNAPPKMKNLTPTSSIDCVVFCTSRAR